MRFLFVLLTVLLAGCNAARVGDNENQQAPRIDSPPPVPPTIELPTDEPPAEIASDGDVRHVVLKRQVDELRTESQNSNNAVQQSLSGLGVNVAKIAEKVDASLLKLEQRVDVSVNAHADLRADLRANAEVQAQAVAKLKAEFLAKLEAQATAQVAAMAGIANKTEAISQHTSAGRDAHVTTQFTREMQSVIERAFFVVLVVVGIAAVAICVMAELSRRRSEGRAKEFLALVRGGHIACKDNSAPSLSPRS